MPDNTIITDDQLRTVFLATELGDNAKNLNRFTYAEKGSSTYSFGLLQFDVGKNGADVQGFLKENGFSDSDIAMLSKHGGLSRTELNTLDTKLQAIPQDKVDYFTNTQLDKIVAGVDTTIDQVRKQNPVAADAISKDPRLQLGIADYENQFGAAGHQFIGFLAGKPEKLAGGTVQTGNTPGQEDIQKFINATGYGHDKANAKAVESRAERLNEAVATLKLGAATKASSHPSVAAGSVLKQGAHGTAVHELQVNLARLGYTGGNGKPLKADSHFGLDTLHAVERFQNDQRLKVDGKVGHETQAALHIAMQAKAAPALDDKRNPDHALYQQALAGVHKAETERGIKPGPYSENVAGALVVAAKSEGLAHIDGVVLSHDGQRAFAEQKGSLPGIDDKLAFVQTKDAVNTTIAQSTAAVAQVNQLQDLAKTPLPQTVTPEQAAPVHDR